MEWKKIINNGVYVRLETMGFLSSFLSSFFYLVFLLFLLFSPISVQNVLADSFGRNYINVISGALILFGVVNKYLEKREYFFLNRKFDNNDYNKGILYFIFSSLVFGLTLLGYFWIKGIWFVIQGLSVDSILELVYIWLFLFILVSRLLNFFVQERIQKGKLIVFYSLIVFSFILEPYLSYGKLRDLFRILPIIFIVIFDLSVKSLSSVFIKSSKNRITSQPS